MRFPLIERVALPATFESYVPGAPHPDGRRYLPLLVFRLAGGLQLGVVDRHHYVDPQLEGRSGSARLVFLLATITLQLGLGRRQGIVAPGGAGGVTTLPEAYGQIVAIPSWEVKRGHLPYDQLYAELLLDVGGGIVGVRTSITADDLAARIGKAELAVGDWIQVARSRVDILGFEATAPAAAIDYSR